MSDTNFWQIWTRIQVAHMQVKKIHKLDIKQS